MDGAPAEPAAADTPARQLPPVPPSDHAADRIYPAGEMAAARARLAAEHGGGTFHMLLANIAERQIRNGRDGLRWDGEGWIGGDVTRLVAKSEGDARAGGRIDRGEAQVLYSRAIDPYWNLQAGVRQDFGRGPSPAYAVVAIEGLAPYWFEVEGSLFLSDRGDLLGRATAYYDQRITQSLILQPRVEFNFAAQGIPRQRIGAGLGGADLDLRLRYEVTRMFAPYVGLSHRVSNGATARLARAAGDDATSTSLVLGVRAWF